MTNIPTTSEERKPRRHPKAPESDGLSPTAVLLMRRAGYSVVHEDVSTDVGVSPEITPIPSRLRTGPRRDDTDNTSSLYGLSTYDDPLNTSPPDDPRHGHEHVQFNAALEESARSEAHRRFEARERAGVAQANQIVDETIRKHIRRVGNRWQVRSADGSRILGEHDTKAGAMRQLRAIETGLARLDSLRVEKQADGDSVGLHTAAHAWRDRRGGTIYEALLKFDLSLPTVLLVRHTEEDGGDEILNGWNDPPLSPEGKAEARNVADTLARLVLVDGRTPKIVSSDLLRAKQTAAAIAQKIDGDTTLAPQLRPWHLGALQGHPTDDVRDQIETLIEHPDQNAPGNGESFNTFLSRFLRYFHGCINYAKTDGLVIVVSHSHNVGLAMAMVNSQQPTITTLLDDHGGPGSAVLFQWDGDQVHISILELARKAQTLHGHEQVGIGTSGSGVEYGRYDGDPDERREDPNKHDRSPADGSRWSGGGGMPGGGSSNLGSGPDITDDFDGRGNDFTFPDSGSGRSAGETARPAGRLDGRRLRGKPIMRRAPRKIVLL